MLKVGLRGASGGAMAGLPQHRHRLVGCMMGLECALVVLHEVEVICFSYGLVLLIFGPLVLHSSGPSLLGLRRMAFTLCSFAHS